MSTEGKNESDRNGVPPVAVKAGTGPLQPIRKKLRVVMKKRKGKRKHPVGTTGTIVDRRPVGIPVAVTNHTLPNSSVTDIATATLDDDDIDDDEQHSRNNLVGEFANNNNDTFVDRGDGSVDGYGDDGIGEVDGDLPCDTLLLMKNLRENRRCMYIPLMQNGAFEIPAVLESQLYQKLRSGEGRDSTVTKELQELLRSNRIRQLSPIQGADQMVAYMETSHFVRAVWDAHRHYCSSVPFSTDAGKNHKNKVTTWFLGQLKSITGRVLPRKSLEDRWMERVPPFSFAIDQLVSMQVLMPRTQESSFVLWLPQWGLVLTSLEKAQTKILNQLKRSHFKELSRATFEAQHFGGFTGNFVMDVMVSSGKVIEKDRPAGKFLQLGG